MKLTSAIALACGIWLSGSVAFAGSAADWVDAEIAAQKEQGDAVEVSDETFQYSGSASALGKKGQEARKKNKVVWFVRGARSKRQARVFPDDGAIERVVVQPVQKGVVITVSLPGFERPAWSLG